MMSKRSSQVLGCGVAINGSNAHSLLDQNIAVMSKLIQEQDGHSLTNDKLELMKTIKELENSYHLLVKVFHQLSARSSINSTSKLCSPNSTIENSSTYNKRISISSSDTMLDNMAMLVEDNHKHLKELAKRYEEKRQVNRELWIRVEKLMEEKHELMEEHNKLRHENERLHDELKQLKINDNKDYSSCKVTNKKHTNIGSHLFNLKTVILGALSRVH
ncbi:hypothetical protein DsansV1_C27g0198711 [Dioscorea sansibarensis]